MEDEPIKTSPIPSRIANATGLKYPEMPDGPNRLDIPASNMTLRDWFAGMALQGIMASGEEWVTEAKVGGWKAEYSFLAYELADAMMKEREK